MGRLGLIMMSAKGTYLKRSSGDVSSQMTGTEVENVPAPTESGGKQASVEVSHYLTLPQAAYLHTTVM